MTIYLGLKFLIGSEANIKNTRMVSTYRTYRHIWESWRYFLYDKFFNHTQIRYKIYSDIYEIGKGITTESEKLIG